MCVFCAEFNQGSKRIIWEDDEWVVIPGSGAFIQGYCLLFSRECYKSFAHLPCELLERAEHVMECVRHTISTRFGPVVIAEHGVGHKPGDYGASCCSDHAHLHFLPTSDPQKVREAYERAGGVPETLSSVAALTRLQGSYLFLSPAPMEYLPWPWEREKFPKQFARRVVAKIFHEPRWDWRKDSFEENMEVTIQALRSSVPW